MSSWIQPDRESWQAEREQDKRDAPSDIDKHDALARLVLPGADSEDALGPDAVETVERINLLIDKFNDNPSLMRLGKSLKYIHICTIGPMSSAVLDALKSQPAGRLEELNRFIDRLMIKDSPVYLSMEAWGTALGKVTSSHWTPLQKLSQMCEKQKLHLLLSALDLFAKELVVDRAFALKPIVGCVKGDLGRDIRFMMDDLRLKIRDYQLSLISPNLEQKETTHNQVRQAGTEPSPRILCD